MTVSVVPIHTISHAGVKVKGYEITSFLGDFFMGEKKKGLAWVKSRKDSLGLSSEEASQPFICASCQTVPGKAGE